MARRVTPENVQQFNEIYFVCHNYAEVARQTGWSASTIKKYIQTDYIPKNQINIIKFDTDKIQSTDEAAQLFIGLSNIGELCILTETEKQNVQEFWKELTV